MALYSNTIHPFSLSKRLDLQIIVCSSSTYSNQGHATVTQHMGVSYQQEPEAPVSAGRPLWLVLAHSSTDGPPRWNRPLYIMLGSWTHLSCLVVDLIIKGLWKTTHLHQPLKDSRVFKNILKTFKTGFINTCI